ncbi:hypothetical protein OM428_07030 [Enterococcus gallinarum]|nr:hypothetical protein [Enterococcus gallinarum]
MLSSQRSLFTKEHIKEILPQCLDAIRFNRQFYLGPILTYSDLGIFSSFIKENQLERLQQSIPQSCTKCQKKTRNYSLLSILFYQQPQLQENCRGSFSAFENDSLSSQQNRAVAGD